MSSTVGQINLGLDTNSTGFKKQLSSIAGNAESMVGGAFKKLGGIIAGAFAVGKILDFSKASIELASNLSEVQNVVDVTFGSMAADINSWSQNMLSGFGLSELSAKKYVSTLGAMMKSSGLSGVAMKDMSKDLTELSADMASFYNLSNDMAFDKIRAGISGEVEPLRQLGINMSVANLEAFALTQGIKKQYENMTQAEQTLLRYNYLLSVTKDAQGDFARTSDSWANQVKLMGEQWKIFQGTMGQGFINILAPVVRSLNTLIAKLQVAAQYFKAFTELITGVKKPTDETTSSVADVGGAAGDAGKGIKKAGKDVKGSISSFDQLNVISQNTADAMGDISDSMANAGGNVDFGTTPEPEAKTVDLGIDATQFQPFLDMINQIKTTTLEAGQYLKDAFGPPLKAALDTITPELQTWKGTLMTTFNDISTLGEPIKNWFINDLVPFWQEEIRVLGEIFNGLLETARSVFNGIRDAVYPILQWFVTEGLPLIVSFTAGATGLFKSIFDFAKQVFDTLWDQAVSPGLKIVSDMVLDVLNKLTGFWKTHGENIFNGLSEVCKNLSTLFQTWWDSFIGPIIRNILDDWKWLWDKHIQGLIDQFLNFVGKLAEGALDIYNKFISPVIKYMLEMFGPTFSEIFKTITDIAGTFAGFIADVAAGILKSLGGIIDFVVGVFTGDWEKAWNGIKDVFGGIWDSMVATVKLAVNLIIDLMNFLISQWNSLKFDIPRVDMGPLGSFGGFSVGVPQIPKIPKLANGGLVSAPTLAMVGDNKNASIDPEVISPLSKLQDMFNMSNQAVVAVLYLILEAIEQKNFSVDMDGERVSRIIRGHLKAEDSRVGSNMVSIGGASV